MVILILVFMAALLIGAVVFGFVRNHNLKGKPGAGRDSAGKVRNSS